MLLRFSECSDQDQGDQIGRIFAHLAFTLFTTRGQIFENINWQTDFTGYFFLGTGMYLTQKWVGQHFGRFSTKSSGHPDQAREGLTKFRQICFPRLFMSRASVCSSYPGMATHMSMIHMDHFEVGVGGRGSEIKKSNTALAYKVSMDQNSCISSFVIGTILTDQVPILPQHDFHNFKQFCKIFSQVGMCNV
jgi:hypothetical protein